MEREVTDGKRGNRWKERERMERERTDGKMQEQTNLGYFAVSTNKTLIPHLQAHLYRHANEYT